MLEKDNAEGILDVTMNGVEQAAGLLTGALHMLETESDHFVDRVRPGSGAASDNEHPEMVAIDR